MKELDIKIPSRNPVIEFDLLKCYFGEPYVIDLDNVEGTITIYPPTFGDLLEYGEKEWYQNLNVFICNTTSYRLILHKEGIDWNELSDFELFIMLHSQVEPKFSELLFHFDISKFELYYREFVDENGENKRIPVLYDEENGIEINEMVYFHISQYLRLCFRSEPKEQITNDPFLKPLYLQKDEGEIRNAEWRKENKGEKDYSLLPVVSAVCNHPGFKYRSDELKQVPVFQFMDSVARLQIYESTKALLVGANSGMADHSKTNPELFNFMRDI